MELQATRAGPDTGPLLVSPLPSPGARGRQRVASRLATWAHAAGATVAAAPPFEASAPALPVVRADVARPWGPALWSLAAAGLAGAAYLLARHVQLGPASGPWAYWPINGLLCGLLFHRPRREWAPIALAAAAGQVGTIYLVRGDLAGGATVTGALGGALQAALGAWLLRRDHAGALPLGSVRELARFVVGPVCLVPLAVTPLSALGFAQGLGLPYFTAWWLLFVGNSLSMLLFAPLVLHGRAEPEAAAARGREVALAQATTLLLAAATFAAAPRWLQYLALPYLVLPLLAWVALRCGPRWTTASIFVIATVSAWCTARGLGPFAPGRVGLDVTVVGLQAYQAFVALTGLLLAALAAQHRRATAQLALEDAVRRQRVELLGQLAAGLAHDVNNLLAVMVSNVRQLRGRERPSPDEEAEMLRDTADAGERAAGLTRRLLAFGRGRGRADADAAVEADAVLHALGPLLRALARSGVEVVTELGAAGARVRADASELEQIALNLVSNARDAIPAEGEVRVATERDGGLWRLRVSDTGVGMDAATRARLFEPFFTTKGEGRGTGLGLFTTALLVRRMGGDVHATSAPGEGSTFVVELPLAAAEA